MEYPQYYRLMGHAIKRESATTTLEIQLPRPGDHFPNSFTPSAYHSEERLNETVAKMERVDRRMFISYIFEYSRVARRACDVISPELQAEFDAIKLSEPNALSV